MIDVSGQFQVDFLAVVFKVSNIFDWRDEVWLGMGFGLRRKVMNLILRIRRALERRGSPRNRCHSVVVADAIPTFEHAMNIFSYQKHEDRHVFIQ